MVFTNDTRKSRAMRFFSTLMFLLFAGLLAATTAQANSNRIIVVDDSAGASDGFSDGYSQTGFNTAIWSPNPTTIELNGPPIGELAHYVDSAPGGVATSTWTMGVIGTGHGAATYSFDAFIPDDVGGNASGLTYTVQTNGGTDCNSGTFTALTSFTAIAHNREGVWLPLGSATITGLTCVRVVLTNASNSPAARVWADAIRMTRETESSGSIVDMPSTNTGFAAGTTYITSATIGTPTQLATMTFNCPRTGKVTVTATGESAAVGNAGGAFIGLAYSITKDSTTTDTGNVVQSSALSTFNGDANRDFLVVQRSDTCAQSTTVTYRLMGYATTPATKIGGVAGNSFIWNARLIGVYTP